MIRNLRRGRRTLTALTVVAAALSLAAAPAFADGSYDDGGPGSSTGGTGGGGPSSGAGYQCGQHIGKLPEGLYHLKNGKWRLEQNAYYPNCDSDKGHRGFRIDGLAQICPVGFEVYRFYADGNAAPTAMTRSRLNLPGWCQGEKTYTFAGQTSWDANPALAPGSPVYIKAADSRDQARNRLPAAVGRRETGNLTSGTPTKSLGSCTTLSRANPLKELLAKASPADQVAYRVAIGSTYAKMAFRGGKTYPRTGAAELGLQWVTGYTYSKANPDPKKPPVRDPKGTRFYAANLKFDDRACNSPFNFAEVRDAATGKVTGASPAIGTCYIPIMRTARLMSNPAGSKAWAYQALDGGGGERYSTFYARRGNTGKAVPTWRAAIAADYLKRAQQPITDSLGRQMYPASHYLAENDKDQIGAPQKSASAAATARELRVNAMCVPGTKVTLSMPGAPPKDEKATLSLVETKPKVLAAGGKAYRAEFRITGGQARLLCKDGKPCGNKATLTNLSYSLTLKGSAGYRQCATGQLSGCDFKIVSSTSGTKSRDGVIVAEFYNGSSPGQGVTLTLKDLTATYAFTVTSSGLTINGLDPVTGGKYTVTTGTVTNTVSRGLTPTVAGRSRAAVYTTSWPVISAVGIPAG